MASKFDNGIHDSKGQDENIIYIKVRGRETFYYHSPVVVKSDMFLEKKLSFGSKAYTNAKN